MAPFRLLIVLLVGFVSKGDTGDVFLSEELFEGLGDDRLRFPLW